MARITNGNGQQDGGGQSEWGYGRLLNSSGQVIQLQLRAVRDV